METSGVPRDLRSDVLHTLDNSNRRLSNIGGTEMSNDITDLVLECFMPATRSATESEIFAANPNPDGFYSTAACSRRSASSAGDGRLFVLHPNIQCANDGITMFATLKRHRAASISSPQHVQREQQQQQHPQQSQQQERYRAGAPGPVRFVVGETGLAQKAAATQDTSLEYRTRVQVGEPGGVAQHLARNGRKEPPLSARATMPVKGASHPDNLNILRSWLYPAYAPGNSRGSTTDGNSLNYMRHNIAQKQSLLQEMLRNVRSKPRAYMAGESSAESAAVPSPVDASTLQDDGLAPPQIMPRAVVVNRGDEAVPQPAPALSAMKPSTGSNGDFQPVTPACHSAPEQGEWSRTPYFITPSVLQRAEVPCHSEREAQRAHEEVGVSPYQRKEGQTFSSPLSVWKGQSDTKMLSGKIQPAKAPTQRSVQIPTDDGRGATNQQHITAAGSFPTTCRPPFPDIPPHLDGISGGVFTHTVVNRAAVPRNAEACSRLRRAPAAAANLVSPSLRTAAVSSKDSKQPGQDDESSNTNDVGRRHTGNCCCKQPDFLGQPPPARMMSNIAGSTTSADPSPVHRGYPISAQPAAANLWAGFFWKSSPHMRLSSSLSNSESCSTQCSSPRGFINGTPGGADADSRSKPPASSAASPVLTPGMGAGAQPATSSNTAFPPWRAPAFLNAPTSRREQQHGPQQGSWPFGYYTTVDAREHAQRIVGNMGQHPRVGEPAKEKKQQQSLLPSSYYSQTSRWSRSPLEALANQTFAAPSWLYLYEATRLEVIGVPRGGGATRLLKSAEILLCKTAIAASCPALGARVKEDRNSRQLIFLLPSREVVPVNHVKLVSCISQGSFGTVFRARWDGKTVAVKQAHGCMTLEAMRSVVREVNSFRSLNHPLILKYLGVCLDPNFLGIITEYLPGKSIFEALWDPGLVLTAAKRLKLCRQLVEAVNYMHTEKRLVHRDLKTSNLILNGEDGLKLCDFGKTRPLALHGRVRLEDNGGSPRYMAPECFAVGNLIDEKVDVWGLGCCLMEIMGGPIPFENIHSNDGEAFKRVEQTSRALCLHDYISSHVLLLWF